jgi:2-keto-4-pentenoate hydratase/2-oxohepta-3-ene-1,7-dioic acid hydratase in catechol pathway
MRLGTILTAAGPAVVAESAAGEVVDVSGLLGGDLAVALDHGRAADLSASPPGPRLNPEELTWLPPIPAPRRILCTGFNYRSHAAESDREVPSHPTFFVRFPSSITGHRQVIARPPESVTLDWEGEIAFVIGRRGRRIPPERALEHVAGYSPFGDNSVREFQGHSTQATAGKNFDATGSWGPWLIPADEVGAPASLVVRTFVNGEQVQEGRLTDLVFGIPELVAYASTFTTLEPGDVIATGTPQGIGLRRDPPVFLAAGDELSVEIDGLCRLSNPVADEPV